MPENNQELTAFKVAGYRSFSENNWKQALTFFLDGIWTEKSKVMLNPQFYFAALGVNLCLNKKTRVYYVDCSPGEQRISLPRPIFSEAQIYFCLNEQLDVEEALKLFIGRKTLRMVELWLPPKKLYLWKDSDEFLCCQIDDLSEGDRQMLRRF